MPVKTLSLMMIGAFLGWRGALFSVVAGSLQGLLFAAFALVTGRKLTPDIEERVLAARRAHRCGPDQLAPDLGVPARTITRILRRNGVPRLHDCDPLTGEVIRASKTTAIRYERDRPGELVHVDVKKLGRILREFDEKLNQREAIIRGNA